MMSGIKPFLLLQLRPEDVASNNEYEAFLKYAELDARHLKRLRIEKKGIPRLNLDDYSAIMVGGSPFDITTAEADKSAIQKQIEKDFDVLLEQIVKADFPFLGACSGNGLLGSYLGTQLSTRYGEPVSSARVTITAAGKDDPLLRDFPDQITVFLGHKEACDTTPAGAILLVRGDACPVQMFRLGSNVYATQFHPEGDAAGFMLRVETYKHHGYFKPEEAGKLIDALRPVKTPHSQKILKRFVKRYACSLLEV